MELNLLSNDKIFVASNLKTFADDNVDVNKNLKCALEAAETLSVKGENAGYQHFLLLPQCFKGFLPQGL